MFESIRYSEGINQSISTGPQQAKSNKRQQQSLPQRRTVLKLLCGIQLERPIRAKKRLQMRHLFLSPDSLGFFLHQIEHLLRLWWWW